MSDIAEAPSALTETTHVDENRLKIFDFSGTVSLTDPKRFLLDRRFQVAIVCKGSVVTSNKSDRGCTPQWNESFLFDNLSSSTPIQIQVYTIRGVLKNQLVGEISETVIGLVSEMRDKGG
ncbi:hypothetical protein SISSUDRAFT_1045799 [Sistotremastrum suecicum HHB10207 ss-3]|uniref:C2 domain-containing protein n=1 Tax=Sistotremastrum suecicum HHB10207 ss-3 TaxID=1314776 RepID=A0A166E920_9AGAM|nr:hypothetical protein SISSUDRAFT_1045799 [Sistotremastrum suecicum HHB10207 ss-3]